MMNNIANSDKILIKSFTITTADTDMLGRIRVGALVNLLIQSAIESAEKLGFGFNNLQTQQLFWVLSRITIEISRPLLWNEKVTVETWPKTIDGILYIRDFIVRDNNNEQEVARATSAWLAIDSFSKRPKRVDAEHTEIFNSLQNKHGLTQLPEKLGKIELGEPFNFNPSYFDIDLNKHVTSTRYVDWIMDSFSIEKILSMYPKRLHLNYQKETMLGELISVYKTECDSTHYQFKGINTHHNVTAFQAEMFF